MNIESKYPVMVFKNINDGKVFYNLGLSKKDKEGNYINGYMACRFKKDVELENQTKISIKKAWLDFYVKDKKTNPYVFISEFETIDQTIERIKEENRESDPYSVFGVSIAAEDLDETFPELPF